MRAYWTYKNTDDVGDLNYSDEALLTFFPLGYRIFALQRPMLFYDINSVSNPFEKYTQVIK